ncbi:hypothetical protein ACIBSV_46880 [Embleya sp. NPDC050154]|uniref:hypothetical protein n=1 Tax=Embleya sp. NPDC050154 TaxID=3363988 RepID=UPI0037A20975
MSAAHLHAVPEPDPDEEPGPGEQATTPPADEQPSRGIATMPDLRPYLDVRQLADLTPHMATAGRLLVGGTGRLLRVIARGLRTLLALAGAWLSGRIGRGSALARIGIALAVVYGIGRTAASHPAGPWVAGGGLLVVVLLAGLGRLPGLDFPKPAKQSAPAKQRAGLAARFVGRRKVAPAAPAAGLPEVPSEPPLTALIRELIGDDNGVHLATLRPAMRERIPGLSAAPDKALSDLLRKAGYDPARKFRAGGREGLAGVHRSQLPPLSPAGAHGPLSTPGDHPRPADSPGAESPGEGAGERSSRRVRYVRDPELGSNAWRIEHDGR